MANEKRHPDDTLSEEVSAAGERVKGAAKDGIGAITGNARLERQGERENAEGRARQATNNVFDETDGVRGATVGSDDVRNSAVLDAPPSAAPVTPATPPNSIREETAAMGQRMKGAVKDAAGAMTGNERLEREGERENAMGRARQAQNDAVDAPGTPRTWDSDWSREHLVTGLYDSPESARHAYHDLTTKHGYSDDDISVVMTDSTRNQHFSDVKPGMELKQGTKAAEGAGIGSGIGIGVGAALGAIVAAATAIAIPGVGLLVAGPIAGALAGAGAGAATGTLLGALIGAGIPETRAVEYERGLKEGGIVLGARGRDAAHAEELERDLTHHGGRHILR